MFGSLELIIVFALVIVIGAGITYFVVKGGKGRHQGIRSAQTRSTASMKASPDSVGRPTNSRKSDTRIVPSAVPSPTPRLSASILDDRGDVVLSTMKPPRRSPASAGAVSCSTIRFVRVYV